MQQIDMFAAFEAKAGQPPVDRSARRRTLAAAKPAKPVDAVVKADPAAPELVERQRLQRERREAFAAFCAPLIEARLVDAYSIGFGYSTHDPRHGERGGIWSLPSRLFSFPVRLLQADDTRPIRLVMNGPGLENHPYVRELAEATGLAPQLGEGSDGWGQHGLWHHAVDLISAGHWRDLLATRDYTTDGHIAGAVAYGLRYGPHDAKKPVGYLTTAEAREIMRELGHPEPADAAALLRTAMEPRSCSSDGKAPHWPINLRTKDDGAAAWIFIVGLELGWFRRARDGHVEWSERGRDAYAGRVMELL